MARKDKPYLPLYIQDFMTDEKLMECSASATGVYIRVMCVMHKSVKYGTFLLKQKDKQSSNQILNFATKLGKHLPYDLEVIISGLDELINEGCLYIEGDILIQKRMVEDGSLSETRSKSGSSGGKKSQSNRLKNKKFAEAKVKANTDIDIDIENDIVLDVFKSEKKTKNMSKSKDTEGIPLPYQEPEFSAIWGEWLQHRKEARIKNYTPTGLKRAFNKLVRESGGNYQVAIEMIDNSISSGYQGIFPLKQNLNGKADKRESSTIGKTIEFDRP